MKKSLFRFALLVFLICSARSAGAITLGQVDNFQDGTLMNWTNGAGAVELIDSGGPTGANDGYIQITANGSSSSGGRLVAQTYTVPPSFDSQWTGNYLAAGVNRIEFDLINQSAVTLSIRIAFKTEAINGSPGYLSAPAVLAVGSGWQHFSISIAPGALIAIDGPASYNTFFQNGFAEMRFINEAGATNLNGTPVVGQLGIDNIRAVPEPTVIALAFAGAALCGARVRRGRRRASRR